jgi:cold-inducible RNA-binding protein
MAYSIYVGNLSYNATENELKGLFDKYGDVVSTKIIGDFHTGRSKGFGFVEMSESNQAQAAIQELHGKVFLERVLKVYPAKPRKDVRVSY